MLLRTLASKYGIVVKQFVHHNCMRVEQLGRQGSQSPCRRDQVWNAANGGFFNQRDDVANSPQKWISPFVNLTIAEVKQATIASE
jgi:hypothetical protein